MAPSSPIGQVSTNACLAAPCRNVGRAPGFPPLRPSDWRAPNVRTTWPSSVGKPEHTNDAIRTTCPLTIRSTANHETGLQLHKAALCRQANDDGWPSLTTDHPRSQNLTRLLLIHATTPILQLAVLSRLEFALVSPAQCHFRALALFALLRRHRLPILTFSLPAQTIRTPLHAPGRLWSHPRILSCSTPAPSEPPRQCLLSSTVRHGI